MRIRNDARRTTTTAVGAALVAVALVAALSGCTPGDAEEPPSATVSGEASASASASPVDPAEAAERERIASAEKRYEEYSAIVQKHRKAGTNGFWDLFNNGYLGNNEISELHESLWERLAEKKVKQTGDSHVVSYDRETYEAGDPLEKDITGHRVQFVVCVDNTEMDLVEPDGSSFVDDSIPKKGLSVIVMQGQPAGNWSVVQDGATREEC